VQWDVPAAEVHGRAGGMPARMMIDGTIWQVHT
jgi:hypothetical protein